MPTRIGAVRVTTDGRLRLAFDEVRVRSGLIDGSLTVYDMAKPEHPVPIGGVTVPAVFDWDNGLIRDFGPIMFTLEGDLLLVAAHALVVLDASMPETPTVVARATLPHPALGLGSDNQLSLVAEEGGTLAAFRLHLAGSSGNRSPPFGPRRCRLPAMPARNGRIAGHPARSRRPAACISG